MKKNYTDKTHSMGIEIEEIKKKLTNDEYVGFQYIKIH